MFSLALDYFLLVLWASCGVIQIVAAHSRLYGLLFVPSVVPGYLAGAALLVSSFTWFVLIGDTGIPGDVGGVEGSQQFGLFLAGTACSVPVTALVASLAQIGKPKGQSSGRGLDVFREATLLSVLAARWGGKGSRGLGR